MARDDKSQAAIWGVRSVLVTVVCTLAGVLLGSIVTLWVAVDVEHAETTEALENAIFELEYNIELSWYNDEKFIYSTHRFSELRDQTLWELYYLRGQLWSDGEKAVADQLLECLNEIDWINRLAMGQHFVGDALFADGEVIVGGPAELGPNIVASHQAMVSHYKTRTQPLMTKLLPYLESKLSDVR